MDSTAHVEARETAPFWTDEKHVHFLNTIEASFVRTVLESNNHRHLPATSESTSELKSHNQRRTRKDHAPSDSKGPKARRTSRRSSQPCNSSQDQVVPQVGNLREAAACNFDYENSGYKFSNIE